jgi:hypothetical protein
MEHLDNHDIVTEWRIEPPPLAGEWLLVLVVGVLLALVLHMVAPAEAKVVYVSSATERALCEGK